MQPRYALLDDRLGIRTGLSTMLLLAFATLIAIGVIAAATVGLG